MGDDLRTTGKNDLSDLSERSLFLNAHAIVVCGGLAIVASALLVPRRYTQVLPVDLFALLQIVYGIALLGTRLFLPIRSRNHLLFFLACFMAFSLVRLLTLQQASYGTTMMFRASLHASTVSICVLISRAKLSKRAIVRLLRGFIAVSSIALAAAIGFSIFGLSLSERLGGLTLLSAGKSFFRASAPLGGPNAVAVLGAVTVVLAPIMGRFSIATAILSVAVVIMSASKTGLLATLAGFTYYWYLSRRISFRRPRWMGVLMLCGLIAAGTLVPRVASLLTSLSALEGGGSGRIGVWLQAVRLIREKPLHGWGTDFLLYNPVLGAPYTAHNLWLQILVDYGIPAGLLLSVTLLLWLVKVIKTLVTGRGDRVGCSIGAALTAMLVSTLGDYLFAESRFAVVFAFAIGLFGMYARRLEGEEIHQ